MPASFNPNTSDDLGDNANGPMDDFWNVFTNTNPSDVNEAVDDSDLGASDDQEHSSPQDQNEPAAPTFSHRETPQTAPDSGNSAPGRASPQAEPSSQADYQPATISEIVAQARELGLSVPDDASDAEVSRALATYLKEIKPFAQYGQQVAPYADSVNKAIQDAHSPPPNASAKQQAEWDAKKYFKDQWGAPEWKPEFDQFLQSGVVVRDDETGMFVPGKGMEGYGAPIANDMNSVQTFNQKRWQEITRGNPIEYFQQKSLEANRREWLRDMEDFKAELQQAQTQKQAIEVQTNFVGQYRNANANWMYTQDEHGREAFTQDGLRLSQTISQLANEFGSTDVIKLTDTAERILGLGRYKPQQATQQGSSPPSVPTAQSAQQKNESYKESFAQSSQRGRSASQQRAAHSPSVGANGVSTPDNQPENIGDRDLETMFAREFAATRSRA